MQSKFSKVFLLSLVATLQLLVVGCTPVTTIVSAHGKYSDDKDRIAEIVSAHTRSYKFVDVDPPASAVGPMIIHGASRDAAQLAKTLAYDLYRTYGLWVPLEAVEAGNHTYSDNYVGVYLFDADYVRSSEAAIRQSVIIVGTDEYIPTRCDSFDGTLVLEPNGSFLLGGSQYDQGGAESSVTVDGNFSRSASGVELHVGDDIYRYELGSVRWSIEGLTRTTLTRIGTPPSRGAVPACDFIQEVDVIERSGEFEVSTHDGPTPDHITRLFSNIGANPPEETRSMAAQRHTQALPAAGREDLLAAIKGPRPVAATCARAETAHANPLDDIERLAQETRLVIVNEAHDRPSHREFIRQIAIRLSNVGYTVFAAETFGPRIGASPSEPFAKINDGYYSNEPVFGNLIRTVKGLGYRLRAYEYRGPYDDSKGQWERANAREEAQAENLMRVLSQMQDNERLLVHVGYSHASEVPIPSFEGKSLRWMAARLKAKSGLDPLTIDNTGCSSTSAGLELSQGSHRHEEGQFDLVVGHPELRFERGRPMYRLSDGHFLVDLPNTLLNDSKRIIIEARLYDEPNDAVPIDRLMLRPGESLPLVLPDGKFRISSYEEGVDRHKQLAVFTQNGRIL